MSGYCWSDELRLWEVKKRKVTNSINDLAFRASDLKGGENCGWGIST